MLSLEYDAVGRLVGRDLAAGDRLVSAPGLVRRIVSQALSGSVNENSDVMAGPVVARQLSCRTDGVLTAVLDQITCGERRFDLDPMGRVRRVDAGNWSESCQYDGSGNVTLEDVMAGEPVVGSGSRDAFGAGLSGASAVEPGAREYAGSLVTRVGHSSFRYNSDGRLITRPRSMLSTKAEVTQFGYNSQDLMVWALTPSAERWPYTDGPMGRQVRKQRLDVGGNVLAQKVFVWDGAVGVGDHQSRWCWWWSDSESGVRAGDVRRL